MKKATSKVTFGVKNATPKTNAGSKPGTSTFTAQSGVKVHPKKKA